MQSKLKLIVLLCSACLAIHAGLPGGTTWEVRTTGADTNGGGFVAGAAGTDYSQQNSAQFNGTDLASSNGSTNPCVVSSASHSFVSTDVGNIIQIRAGTSWTTGFYEVVSVASNNATLDRACGSTASISSGTWAEGGALASWAKLETAIDANQVPQIAWVQAGTYNLGSSLTFTCCGANADSSINGYTSSRGDGGSATVHFTAGGVILQNNGSGLTMRNLILDLNSELTSGFTLNKSLATATNIKAINVNSRAFNINLGTCVSCSSAANALSGGSTFFIGGGICIDCQAFSGHGAGFEITVNTTSTFICIRCIAANMVGASADGFINDSEGAVVLINCNAYGNGRDGFHIGSAVFAPQVVIYDSIFENNAGYGLNYAATGGNQTSVITWGVYEDYNAFYGNTTGATRNFGNTGPHDQTCSSDPLPNGVSNNFAPASSNTCVIGAGFPGTLLSGGTGYQDIGALQHQATSSGGQHGTAIIQ